MTTSIGTSAPTSLKEYFVCFFNMEQVAHIRDLKSEHYGTLVSFSGTVTRTSEVRPELFYGGFTCVHCGTLTSGIEQQFQYEEPKACPNVFCTNTSDWQLQMDDSSLFLDWQRVKVQENADEIPPGMLVHVLLF